MIDIDTPVYFTAPDGQRYRVTVSYDSDTDSPRTWTNGTIMHTFDSSYNSPDGERCQDRRHNQIHPLIPGDYVEGGTVDMRRARRYVTLFDADCIAIAGLHRGHDGTLSLSFAGDNSQYWETDGYIMITSDTWAETMGEETVSLDMVEQIMTQEVDVYNKWASGEFTSVLVEREQGWQAIDAGGVLGDEDRTMTTWEVEHAVGGFDDGDAAFEDGVAALPDGSDREE